MIIPKVLRYLSFLLYYVSIVYLHFFMNDKRMRVRYLVCRLQDHRVALVIPCQYLVTMRTLKDRREQRGLDAEVICGWCEVEESVG